MQKRVHIIQQEEWVAPGAILDWAIERGFAVTTTRVWEFESLPERAEADLLVILGGWQSPATTPDQCPHFDSAAQQRLIRAFVDAGRAVLGVCLGAQLLGSALGAPFARSPEREIGAVPARLTEAGRADRCLRAFPDVFEAGQWHADMPGLTPDAAVLAVSEGCPRQIVRYGEKVYGFQTHMEFTRAIIEGGIASVGGEIRAKGRFVQSADELRAIDYGRMNALLKTFLDALMS